MNQKMRFQIAEHTTLAGLKVSKWHTFCPNSSVQLDFINLSPLGLDRTGNILKTRPNTSGQNLLLKQDAS